MEGDFALGFSGGGRKSRGVPRSRVRGVRVGLPYAVDRGWLGQVPDFTCLEIRHACPGEAIVEYQHESAAVSEGVPERADSAGSVPKGAPA